MVAMVPVGGVMDGGMVMAVAWVVVPGLMQVLRASVGGSVDGLMVGMAVVWMAVMVPSVRAERAL